MKGLNKDSSHQESLGVSVSYSSVQIKAVWTDGSQILVKFCNFSESFFFFSPFCSLDLHT